MIFYFYFWNRCLSSSLLTACVQVPADRQSVEKGTVHMTNCAELPPRDWLSALTCVWKLYRIKCPRFVLWRVFCHCWAKHRAQSKAGGAHFAEEGSSSLSTRSCVNYIQWTEISIFQHFTRSLYRADSVPSPFILLCGASKSVTIHWTFANTSHPSVHSILSLHLYPFPFYPSRFPPIPPPPFSCSPRFSDLWFMVPALWLKHEYFTRTKYNF